MLLRLLVEMMRMENSHAQNLSRLNDHLKGADPVPGQMTSKEYAAQVAASLARVRGQSGRSAAMVPNHLRDR